MCLQTILTFIIEDNSHIFSQLSVQPHVKTSHYILGRIILN